MYINSFYLTTKSKLQKFDIITLKFCIHVRRIDKNEIMNYQLSERRYLTLFSFHFISVTKISKLIRKIY